MDGQREPMDNIQKVALAEFGRQVRSLKWADIPRAIKLLSVPVLFFGFFMMGGLYFFFLVAGLFLAWYGIIYHKLKTRFWKDFAAARGWVYEEGRTIEGEKALLFRQGKHRAITQSVRGEYSGQPLSIFEYQYTIGSGKSKRTLYYTIFEVTCAGTFPHFFLNNISNGEYLSFGEKMWLPRLTLPDGFEKKFVLYAPKQYEIEALEIFTPDTLQFLLDTNWPHDLELVDSEIIISCAHHMKGNAELEAELTNVQTLVNRLAPQLNRMRLTQIGDYTATL